MGEEGATLTVSDYSSKQNNGKRGRFSLHSSQLLQGDMSMGGPHSLLAICGSAEKQTFHHDWYRGRNAKKEKANTW